MRQHGGVNAGRGVVRGRQTEAVCLCVAVGQLRPGLVGALKQVWILEKPCPLRRDRWNPDAEVLKNGGSRRKGLKTGGQCMEANE